jgi:2-polyprenyl-6-methoxyphenol hydroxylase-like FAD-dependent oxidoreductase
MKSSPRPTRVAIIGAGPAGATTALLPARRGASVVLLDDGRRLELVVCESLVPRLTEIFQRLGIEEQVRALGVRKPGVTFAFDDGDDFELSFSALRGVLPNYAYNVPRREFDQFLLDTALAAGASYVETVAKLDADPALDSVCLAPETLARTPAWDGATPDVIIDASGRRRLFAKLLGISAETGPRRDISHFAHYENAPWPEPHGQVVIGRLEHGWSTAGAGASRCPARGFPSGWCCRRSARSVLARRPRSSWRMPSRTTRGWRRRPRTGGAFRPWRRMPTTSSSPRAAPAPAGRWSAMRSAL